MARLAINPNTVLKAYRELEHDGLVAARPGIGTFVTADADRRLAGRARPAAPGPAALAGQGPPGRARRREHRGAVHDHLSDRRTGGHSVTAVLRAQGLGKSYGRRCGADRLHAGRPGRAGRRAGRPQRGRQEHAAEPGRRHADADIGHDRGARRPPRGRPGAAGQGRLRRPGHADLRRAERRRPSAARRPAQPGLGRRPGARAGSSGSAWTPRSGPASCPAASAPSSRSRWASPSAPSC